MHRIGHGGSLFNYFLLISHFTSFLFTLLTGHLPFHTIAKLSTVRRKRRDVEAEGSSNKLAFSLSLSNVTHSFEMTPSTDILSPRYVLEEVSEDGRLVTVPSTVKDCYYIQDIRQTGLSAVTVCKHTVVSIIHVCSTMQFCASWCYCIYILSFVDSSGHGYWIMNYSHTTLCMLLKVRHIFV